MAGIAAKTGEHVAGDLRMTFGTYDGNSTTTGTINTGLHQVVMMCLTATGAGIVADAPTINATFPCDGSSVAVITTSDKDFYWVAWGW